MGCLNDAIKRAVTSPLPHGRYAYVAPYLSQAKEVAWEYLKRYTAPILEDKNEAELWVQMLGGARLRIHGADNPDRLRGAYLDGVVLDEYADMRPGVWGEIIRPMLADRKGWATFIGTPKGKNDFWRVCEKAKTDPAWFSSILRASETGILDGDELADAKGDMTPEQYAQEFECSFDAAIIGAYYAAHIAQAERAGRVGVFPHDPALPVHTVWDLGIGDSTAIWLWQAAPDGIRIIDHIEDHGKALPFYVASLNVKEYKYGNDFVPHDAKARELGTGRTRVETLINLGRNPVLVPMHTVEDGINAVRQLFGLMHFNVETTAGGLEALRQYRTDYDEKMKVFKDRPRHDWTSHTADAMRYLAMAYREIVLNNSPAKKKMMPGQVLLQGAPELKSGVRIKI